MDKAERSRTDLHPSGGKQTKTAALAEAGISTSAANLYEVIAGGKDEASRKSAAATAENYFATARQSGEPSTVQGLRAAIQVGVDTAHGGPPPAKGRLIDGRNRLAACEIAGIEPHYLMMQSTAAEAEAFIWSANAKRRQMTKGQMAMVAAMAFTTATVANPDGRTKGRQDEGKANAAKAAGVSPQRLSYALLVKKHASDLAQSVIDGWTTLDAAYEQAKAREKAAEWQINGLGLQADPSGAGRSR